MIDQESCAAEADDGPFHPLLRIIANLVERCREMTDHATFEADPAWLRIPADRRLRTLRRYQAVLDYLDGERTMERARAGAKSAGVSLRTFYVDATAMEEANRDIFSLVPHLQNRSPGRDMLDEETMTVLRVGIREAVNEGVRGTLAIASRVAERWPPDGPPVPSLPTLRHHVDSRGGFDAVERGTISLNTGGHAQETADTATTHGEVLVIDHTALDLFLDHSSKPKRASVTFALDLFTASVAGFVLAKGPPRPTRILDVLNDVAKRNAANPGDPIRPRLLLAATNGEEWDDLVTKIDRRGLKAKVRWGTALHFGGPTRRMIGRKLGEVGLYARKMHAGSRASDSFDPNKHPLVTLEQAEIVVEDAVRSFNKERLAGVSPARIVTNT